MYITFPSLELDGIKHCFSTKLGGVSKGIFESMRGDIKKELREEVKKEVREEIKKEVREEIKKEVREESSVIFTLFADGKSEKEVLKAFPELTSTEVEKMRQEFEKLKIKMNAGS